MNEREREFLDVLVPRGLVGCGNGVLSGPVTAEGLCPLRVTWENGRISCLEGIRPELPSSLKILLPRFPEPHAHIDKAFTWKESPNLTGGYQGAFEANRQEHKNRSGQSVYARAERSLNLAINNGCRAIRSHIDSFDCCADQSWEVLIDLRRTWQSLIELQLVALVPLEYWSTSQGSFLAARVARAGGLLGGVLVPPFDRKAYTSHLFQMIKLANQFDCGIDLHIDESYIQPAAGLKLLVQLLDQIQISVPITCSHVSSMGLLPSRDLRRLADRLLHHHVNVVALPLTNAWLLARQPRRTPVKRPLAPISQLQHAGVTVAVGGDNVQDSWFPAGNFDPLALMSSSMPLTQLAPWQRLGLAPFTTAAAEVMNLEWDGTIRAGSPADLVLLDASSWSEALSKPPVRTVLIDGVWLDKTIIPMKKNIDEES